MWKDRINDKHYHAKFFASKVVYLRHVVKVHRISSLKYVIYILSQSANDTLVNNILSQFTQIDQENLKRCYLASF